jgi:hypothetical protein
VPLSAKGPVGRAFGAVVISTIVTTPCRPPRMRAAAVASPDIGGSATAFEHVGVRVASDQPVSA